MWTNRQNFRWFKGAALHIASLLAKQSSDIEAAGSTTHFFRDYVARPAESRSKVRYQSITSLDRG